MMIRNEKEYQEAVEILTEEKKRLKGYRAHLKEQGLDATAIKNVMDPMESFHLQLVGHGPGRGEPSVSISMV